MGTERGARTGGLLFRLAIAAGACAALSMTAASCSLLVQTGSDQCQAVADCASFPGLRACNQGVCEAVAVPPACQAEADCKSYANAACINGACVRGGTCDGDAYCGDGAKCEGGACKPAGTDCEKSEQCKDRGPFFVCRKTKCVSLVNDLCTTVYTTKKNAADAYLDDNAFFFGSILPTVGGDADYGTLVEDSIKLAIDDFAKVNGIPSTTGNTTRPLVLVGCNDGENEDRTDDAAKHLVDDLGVPAIIGYAFSGNTISVATDVTIKSDVLLFSPAATSNDITMLNDNDLVWRTAPRDEYQAAALAQYYDDVEGAVKKRYPTVTGDMKVAIIHHNDAYGAGLADVLQGKLSFNGKTAAEQLNGNYKRFNYGDSGSPDLNIVANVKAFAPHVIFLFGFNEGPETILTSIESQWAVPADMHRPMWVLSDGGQVPVLWEKAIKSEDLRTRVTGSVPGVNTSYGPYNTFRTQWFASSYAKGGTRSPDTIGTSGAYDITYLLAYSAVAVGANPLTGPNLVKAGLRKMVPGTNVPQVTIGPSSIVNTFPKLAAGQPIDIEGTSGPLDFDTFGEAPSDIQIWCVPKGSGTVADPSIYSGRYYDYKANKTTGTISADCGLP
ncbi:Branched-chain amino acid ABC transporter, amino acid-binding protein [Minicystis rosea]|nr:Branched-chain amino acid ABC transporter, amino acid-binding protein [Minicystis rosea]